jgi:xanthine dehydrogenase YagS FAD-binding subunit
MNRFALANVMTQSAALDALKNPGGISFEQMNRRRPLAGGIDLLGEIKDRIIAPETLVNLKPVGELHGIAFKNSELRIGATTTLVELIESETVNEKFFALAAAARHVGSPQIRNVGTVGGNLCQRPRCWYYRHPDLLCYKKGGEQCLAVEGENKYHAILGNDGPCHIVSPSNLGVALLVLDGKVVIASPRGERIVTAGDFFRLPTRDDPVRETNLQADEIVTAISLPQTNRLSTYIQFSEKEAFDWALVSAAASIQVDGWTISDVRLALGAVAPVPWRLNKVEEFLLGKTLNDDVLSQAADLAVADARPLSQNAYKVKIAKALVKRVLKKAARV